MESSHGIAHILKIAPKMSADEIIIVNLSGRGDKDVEQVQEMLGRKYHLTAHERESAKNNADEELIV